MADHEPAQRMGQMVSLCGVCLAFTQCLVIAIPVICIKLMTWKSIVITFSYERNLVANEFIATLRWKQISLQLNMETSQV